jgi:outer membrane protein OmpA-like peptidoglycan-associated protein
MRPKARFGILLTCLMLLLTTQINGQNASKWLTKGDQAFAAKQYAKAIDYYEWAEKTDGWKASLGLANAWRAKMDYAKAAGYYAKVVHQPEAPIATYFYYGQSLMAIRNYPEAEIWFARYAKAAPADPRATTFRGLDKLVAAVMRDSGQYSLNPIPVNSKYSDFSPAFFENGILFVSARPNETGVLHSATIDDAPLLDLYCAFPDSSGKWSKPKVYSQLNSKFNEGPMAFDGLQGILYLTRNDPNHKKNRDKSERQGLNRLQIDVYQLQDGQWQRGEAFPYNNTRYAIGHPALSPDGKVLYFASDMSGGFGGTDLYASQWNEANNEWSQPVNLGPVVNTSENELFPFVDAQSQLYFASNGHLGLGGLDVFTVRQSTEGQWFNVQNLGYPLNTESDDFGMVLNQEGTMGYLSSNRNSAAGDDNIYEFKRNWPRFECAPQLKNNYCFQFWESGVIDADTMPLAYEWDFGDGFKARGLEAWHCYDGPGEYLVSLYLIDTVSGYVFLNQTEYVLTVKDTEQVYIDCPQSVGAGEEFTFSGKKSILEGCQLTNYYWDLGDGNRETLSEFTYSYREPGQYEIRLGVDGDPDAKGELVCKHCVTKTITVLPLAEIQQQRDSVKSARSKALAAQAIWDRSKLVQKLLDAGEKQYDMRDSLQDGKYSVLLQQSTAPINTKSSDFQGLRDLREVRTAEGYEVHSGLEENLQNIAPYFFEGHRAGFEDAIVVVVRDSANPSSPKKEYIQIPAKKTDLGYTLFSANVLDALGNPLKAEITFEELNSGLEVVIATSDSSGKLEVRLPNGSAYAWYLGTSDYFPASGVVDLLGVFESVSGPTLLRNRVTLSSIAELMESGEPIRINNVFFDFDAATLRSESTRQLDRLAELLLQYKDYGVKVESHTDDKGNDNYNLSLSHRRAEAVLQYLARKGFSSERIKSEGFGEAKPAVPNDSPENCQFNRRVEFSLFPLSK